MEKKKELVLLALKSILGCETYTANCKATSASKNEKAEWILNDMQEEKVIEPCCTGEEEGWNDKILRRLPHVENLYKKRLLLFTTNRCYLEHTSGIQNFLAIRNS